MKKDTTVILRHILDAVHRVEEYTKNGKDDFFASYKTQDATQYNLQIIGEAVRHLPEDLLLQFATIPWKEIVGMRHLLVHEYFQVETELIWNVVEKDLPTLKSVIITMIRHHSL
jgi:uncharacterized protein with HEPN domain